MKAFVAISYPAWPSKPSVLAPKFRFYIQKKPIFLVPTFSNQRTQINVLHQFKLNGEPYELDLNMLTLSHSATGLWRNG